MRIVLLCLFAVLTVAVFGVLAGLSSVLGPARHRRPSVSWVTALRIMGLWELAIGGLLISYGGWISSIGPIWIGAAMLLGAQFIPGWNKRP